MNKEKIISNIINSISPTSNKSIAELLNITKFKSITPKQIFIERNTKNEYEYFILTGICRSYLINSDGDDITISFFQDNSILTPHITRTFNNLSNLNFQAITDLEIGLFRADKLVDLMIKNMEIRNFANTVLQNELIQKVEKEIMTASLSAKERLIEFRKQFNSLENKIPHPYIASYLGITNISLSRLRGDLVK